MSRTLVTKSASAFERDRTEGAVGFLLFFAASDFVLQYEYQYRKTHILWGLGTVDGQKAAGGGFYSSTSIPTANSIDR